MGENINVLFFPFYTCLDENLERKVCARFIKMISGFMIKIHAYAWRSNIKLFTYKPARY